MQLERVKQVGKKKVLGIATALMLVGGGTAAFASEPVQDAVKTAVDGFFSKTIAVYINNVDGELSTYAETKKQQYSAYLASIAPSFSASLKAQYDAELKQAKADIDKHVQEKVQTDVDYANTKNQEAVQQLSDKVKAVTEQKNAELDAYVDAEFEKSFNNN